MLFKQDVVAAPDGGAGVGVGGGSGGVSRGGGGGSVSLMSGTRAEGGAVTVVTAVAVREGSTVPNSSVRP